MCVSGTLAVYSFITVCERWCRCECRNASRTCCCSSPCGMRPRWSSSTWKSGSRHRGTPSIPMRWRALPSPSCSRKSRVSIARPSTSIVCDSCVLFLFVCHLGCVVMCLGCVCMVCVSVWSVWSVSVSETPVTDSHWFVANRIWDCYTGLDSVLKNFMTTLPLVSSLRSPAMRPRHWKQLMTTTGVAFSTCGRGGFCLGSSDKKHCG